MLIPKLNYIRDPKWRRFISTLPCMRCKIEGKTQAAHLGKGGRGIKAGDDTCAPLCCASTELGCHEKYDQYLDWSVGERAKALNTAVVAYGFFNKGQPDEAERMFRRF